MALIDYSNKVIYWDEVNWQWLPFVSIRFVDRWVSIVLRKDSDSFERVNSKEEVLNFLKGRGYILTSLGGLGITELSPGCFLYKGKVYKRDGVAIRGLSGLLVEISGKSKQSISGLLKGKGVISKELLEKLISGRGVIKFRGKSYSSYAEISREYGFDSHFVSSYIRKGFTLEEIVSRKYDKRSVKDHLGNEYKTTKEMVRAWGISLSAYTSRRRMGWSLERSLCTPGITNNDVRECRDFYGNIFPSLESMCEKYGVKPTPVKDLVRKGMTEAEAVNHLLSKASPINVKDHLDNGFSSITKMTEYWGVHRSTFRRRINSGWSLEEALTGKRGDK